MSRPQRILIVLTAAMGLLALTIGIVRWRQPKDRDPLAATSSQNTSELVSADSVAQLAPANAEPTFVGRQVCGECHAENFRLHAAHGHAATFVPAAQSDIGKQFAGQSVDGGDRYGRYTYALQEQGLVATLPDKFGDDPFPLHYALGSGRHAVTLLSLIADSSGNTQGIEHRVSWYHSGSELDLTPGHAEKVPVEGAEFFGDKITDKQMRECVSCHTTSGEISDGNIVDLRANVNCEKCHGPGSEHVRLARQSKTPPPFSVGRSDWDSEAELNLCGQCHRLPDHLTAKQLRDYPPSVIRFQPVGMVRSECFVQSEGTLRCTTCHNPHTTATATTTDQYEQICINCHQPESADHVGCSVSPRDDCIECHMPKVNFIRDIGFHDHWIRVRDR